MCNVNVQQFGKTKEGQEVNLYVITTNSLEVGLINYGASVNYLKTADRNGRLDDVVTGFQDMESYQGKANKFFGGIIGRVANRIARGKFEVDGVSYSAPINNGPNSNHGGLVGFDRRLWEAEVKENSVVFSLVSGDGEEGFPGEVRAEVEYSVHDNEEMVIDYRATTTRPTPVNLTNHTYFNLAGHGAWSDNMSEHEIVIPADEYLPVDEHCLVTGEIASVSGTAFDLRQSTALTEQLLASVPGGGFDNTFCLQRDHRRHRAAVLTHAGLGRTLTVDTTAPGIHLYSGNFLTGAEGKHRVRYPRHSAVCLETQNWPDAVNRPDKFPDSILRPGKEYRQTTWYRFSAC